MIYPIRCMVVDDEPGARAVVEEMIAPHDGLTVTGSFGDPVDALEAMHQDMPDLLFLDVQMPRLTGFELLSALLPARPPVIVFVTAYDEHAIQAFDVSALDYLLKPFEEERFASAVQRAVAAHEARHAPGGEQLLREHEDALRELIRHADKQGTRYQRRLPVSDGARIRLLPVTDIEFIQADGNHVRVYADGRCMQMRDSLLAIEKRLDPAHFARVHRSQIVNIERVVELESTPKGEYILMTRGGHRVVTGRTYRDRVRALFRLE